MLFDKFKTAFQEAAQKEIERISPWVHKEPMLVSTEKFDELHKLQQIICKAIRFFVANYWDYEYLMPISDKAKEIIKICENHPYKIGTYRPDFIIDVSGNIRLCEINARSMYAYLFSGVTELIAGNKAKDKGLIEYKVMFDDYTNDMLNHLCDFKRICSITSYEKPQDIRYHSPIFKTMGIEFFIITAEEILEKADLLTGSAVINEFDKIETEALDLEIIEKIASKKIISDFRTIFFIRDKRFLSVLLDKEFMSKFLNKDEIDFLLKHIIQTYTREQNRDIWEKARNDKDNWIIKHCLLGKSEKVYAGSTKSEEEWNNIFESDEIEDMILQPFIKQKRFPAMYEDRIVNEYVVGTILCFNENYYGPGLFRASTYPVTNQGDDRKIVQLITDDRKFFKDAFVL